MNLQRPSRCPRPNEAHGAALLAVLVLIALLTLLASTVAAFSVGHRRSAQQSARTVQADLAADSAIRLVILRLSASANHAAAEPFERRQHLEVLGAQVTFTLEREAGRVDLNKASEELLAETFATRGWSEMAAQAMAARIQDWRDSDDMPQANGAEQAEYLSAGLNYGPRNGPFESPEELRQVLGGTKIGRSLLDAFTVYSHLEKPSVEAGEAAAVLAGEVVRARACTALAGYARCREAILRLTGNMQRPFQIFAWRTQLDDGL